MPQQAALQECPPTEFFDCAQEVFRLATEAWIGRAIEAGQALFVSLAVLEIVVTGYVYWMGRGGSGQDLLSRFAFKLGLLAFVLGLFSTYHHWLPLIPVAFGEGAVHIGGSAVESLSPTHLINVGIGLFLATMKALGLAADVVTVLAFVPAALILLCFVALGVHLLVTLVESYIVVTGGLVFVGFMAFRGTAPLGEGYLQYVLYVGIKLFFIMLIASVAAAIGDDMVAMLGTVDNLWLAIFESLFALDPGRAVDSVTSRLGFIWSMTAVAFLLAGLGLSLPHRIAERLSRGLRLDVGRLLERL